MVIFFGRAFAAMALVIMLCIDASVLLVRDWTGVKIGTILMLNLIILAVMFVDMCYRVWMSLNGDSDDTPR